MKVLVLLLFFNLCYASTLSTTPPAVQEELQRDISIQEYRQAYKEAFGKYRTKIAKNFKKIDIGSKNRWVSYINNFKTKNIIDYENEKIIIQTYAKNISQAREIITKRFTKLLQMSIDDAFNEDFVEQEVMQTLHINKAPQSQKPLIGDIYSSYDAKKTKKYIQNSPIKRSRYKNSNIYTMEIELPPQAMLKKAKAYKKTVGKYAYKNHLPMELIYAVIHSESSFNPLARSRTPAFGLMQIVPQTAGVDSYKFLYGKKRVLSASYLYNEEKNIKIGTAYLHLLFYRYFNKIEDPLKRLYVTIAAYNCGAGNLAKTFVGTTDMQKASEMINKLQGDKVYEYLLNNLPFEETKLYLQRVNERIFAYRSWILESQL